MPFKLENMFYLHSIRITEKAINFNNKKVNKNNFRRTRTLFKIDDIHVDKILISKKKSYGRTNSFKYFILYEDLNYICPLCIRFPQMIVFNVKKCLKKMLRMIVCH